MSKDSNFTGQPVYNQVLNLLDREKIMQISRETSGSESYVKRFDGYHHLVVMLFGILKHFDSLRELEIGMKAEAHKLHHLGLDYLVRRSTLAEANIRRPQEFFAKVYAYLLERYAKFLADSRPPKSYKGQTNEPKDWEKLLYMMDSTTITLFDNILKGVGRHPKSGKKKGGMKVHTVMKYHVGVPMVVQLTSAAKHDHYLLKEVHLPKDSTLAIDRAYIDIAQFQRLTEEGVCYVTKMKKNLKFETLESVAFVNTDGLVTHIDRKVRFARGEAYLMLDSPANHLYGEVNLAHGILINTPLYGNVLIPFCGVSSGEFLPAHSVVALPAFFPEDGKVEEHLADTVGNAEKKSFEAEDAAVFKMGVDTSDILHTTAGLREVRIINHQAGIFRLVVTADNNLRPKLADNMVHQLAPVGAAIVEKLIEHIFTTTKLAA